MTTNPEILTRELRGELSGEQGFADEKGPGDNGQWGGLLAH